MPRCTPPSERFLTTEIAILHLDNGRCREHLVRLIYSLTNARSVVKSVRSVCVYPESRCESACAGLSQLRCSGRSKNPPKPDFMLENVHFLNGGVRLEI